MTREEFETLENEIVAKHGMDSDIAVILMRELDKPFMEGYNMEAARGWLEVVEMTEMNKEEL